MGHWVINALVAEASPRPKLRKMKTVEGVTVCRAGLDVFLAKPRVYMNHSGAAIRDVLDCLKIQPSSCLVILDDVYLPVGKIRFRDSGSSGGHNGLQSVIDAIETSSFPRLRIGIGREEVEGDRLSDYVLSCFPQEDSDAVDKSIQLACQAAWTWIEAGSEAVMRGFN